MAERKPLPKKTRFEVFKRDKFTCQYCGRSAPDVVLQVDHIEPVADGGTNDILNLVTACAECNSGKGARRLSDDAAIKAKKAQLDELADRREQIEMMYEWQLSLVDNEEAQIDKVEELISTLSDYGLSKTGRENVRKYIRKFGYETVMDATRISFTQYDHETKDEFEFAFRKIGGICYFKTHKTCQQCTHQLEYDKYSKESKCEYDHCGGQWCKPSFAEHCEYYVSRYGGGDAKAADD